MSTSARKTSSSSSNSRRKEASEKMGETPVAATHRFNQSTFNRELDAFDDWFGEKCEAAHEIASPTKQKEYEVDINKSYTEEESPSKQKDLDRIQALRKKERQSVEESPPALSKRVTSSRSGGDLEDLERSSRPRSHRKSSGGRKHDPLGAQSEHISRTRQSRLLGAGSSHGKPSSGRRVALDDSDRKSRQQQLPSGSNHSGSAGPSPPSSGRRLPVDGPPPPPPPASTSRSPAPPSRRRHARRASLSALELPSSSSSGGGERTPSSHPPRRHGSGDASTLPRRSSRDSLSESQHGRSSRKSRSKDELGSTSEHRRRAAAERRRRTTSSALAADASNQPARREMVVGTPRRMSVSPTPPSMSKSRTSDTRLEDRAGAASRRSKGVDGLAVTDHAPSSSLSRSSRSSANNLRSSRGSATDLSRSSSHGRRSSSKSRSIHATRRQRSNGGSSNSNGQSKIDDFLSNMDRKHRQRQEESGRPSGASQSVIPSSNAGWEKRSLKNNSKDDHWAAFA